MKRFILVLGILFIGVSGSIAQGLNYTSGVQGVWAKPGEEKAKSTDWKASWIWAAESSDADKILARRSFELEEIPSEALLSITASFKYRLYVNGSYVGSGPARSAPHHQYYDKLDIKSLLKQGNNTIAVEVHYLRGKLSYHREGRGGLLAQLDYIQMGEAQSLMTNDKWKVAVDPSWSNDAPRISRFQLVPSDLVDLRKKIEDWESNDFDDSKWTAAAVLMRNDGWPSVQKNDIGIPLTFPWTSLLLRDFPYVAEVNNTTNELVYAQILDSVELTKPIPLEPIEQANTADLDIEYLKSVKKNHGLKEAMMFVYDFGSAISGMPHLELQGSSGTEVEIRAAPFLVNNSFSHKVVFSNFLDRITLSGKKDKWEGFYFKPTRYLAVVVKGDYSSVTIDQVGLKQLSYPFKKTGSLISDDAPWISDYTDATERTILACTTDAYTDNYRERRQYAQTGYYGAMGNQWIFGDTDLQRRYLQQTAHEQKANGIMPAYGPLASDDYMIILDSNCLWIRSLRDFYLYSGDTVSVKRLLPAAQKLMDLLHSFTNELGLIDNPPYPYWLDHALIDRRGANLNLNGHYLGALVDYAQILSWLGDSESEIYSLRANLLRQSVREQFWNEEHQLFTDALIDSQQSEHFTEHGNAMALAMKIATREQGESICKTLLKNDGHNFVKRANGMTVVTPAMSYFLHKGICEYGFIDESLAMFRHRFDKMLDPKGNQTLYEEWWLDGTGRSGTLKPTSRSDAQTESCFPPALFGEYLLGLTPTQPGYKEADLKFIQTEVKHLKATVPTVLGSLIVEWNGNFDQRILNLNIPKGMVINLNVESMREGSDKVIYLNNELVQKSETELKITSGQYEIKF